MTKPKVSYADFKAMSFNFQVGGNHYTQMKIQPMQFSTTLETMEKRAWT